MSEKPIYNDIQTMEGIDIVRKRPGQFVGSPKLLEGEENSEALLQLYQEVLSNAIDEAYAGYGNEIDLTIHPDNSMTVLDHGRGMPKGENFDKVRRALTVLYSSNKYGSSAYAQSIGQNGVGIKATNALSDWLELEAQNQAGDHYYIKVHMQEILDKKDFPYDEKLGTFTKITFLPDSKYFEGHINWVKKLIEDKLEKSSYLTPKVKFVFKDERDNTEQEFYSEYGLIDYLKKMTEGEEYLIDPISFDRVFDNMNVEGAIAFINSSETEIYSFANGAETVDDGTHVTGYKKGVYNALNDFAKQKKLLKRGQILNENDTYAGLVGTILVKLPEDKLVFNSQSKTKLSSPEGNKIAKTTVYDKLSEWLYDNIELGQKIVENIIATTNAKVELENSRREFAKVKKTVKEIQKKNADLSISPKLVQEINKRSKEKELYIVEGDSAAGSVRASRSENQALFPIRGKILNAKKHSLAQCLNNQEISTIIGILGCGIGEDYDEKKLRYDKLVIAADADADGSHIQSLLLVMFWRFMPDFIRNGHVYVANAPLYRLTRYEGKEQISDFAFNDEEQAKLVEKWNSKKYQFDVTRFKGLGESSADELGYAIMDEETRHLTCISMADANHMKEVDHDVELTMGNGAGERKEWLSNLMFDATEID